MARQVVSLDDETTTSQATIGFSQQATTLFPTSWKSNIEFISHLTLFNHVMISVMADKGAGKTTFIDKLQQEIDGSIHLYVTDATLPFKSKPIVTDFAKRFNLKLGRKTAMQDIIAQIDERRIPVLMVIDNAENIEDEWLEEILDVMQNIKSSFFHICLVSDFSISTTLNQLEKKYKNLTHTLELGGLNEEELVDYVTTRYPDEPFLEDCTHTQWHRLFELTAGKIARVNLAVPQWIENCKEDAPPTIIQSKSPYTKWIFGGIVASFVAAGLYVYQDTMLDKWFEMQAPTLQVTAKNETNPEIYVSSLIEVPIFSSKLAVIDTKIFENVPHPSSLPFYSANADRRFLDQVSVRRIKIDGMGADEVNEKLALIDKVVVTPKIKKHNIQKPTQQGSIQTTAVYTIQLAAAMKIDSLQEIVRTNHLTDTTVREATINGTHWYLLTTGQYATREEAMANLPKIASLSRLNAWVKQVG